jgi:FKBP-type peptidyl-prolyl cis-trans isomerase
MRVGDSAFFVLPPHLAHGLIGDQKKIPRMAIISYNVILQGLQKQEEE